MNPPSLPSAPPIKKGLQPLAWFGIGCGGLLVVGIIAIGLMVVKCGVSAAKSLAEHPGKTAAETAVSMHPDLEVVSQDNEGGTMVLRLKSSGEQITATFDELAQGRTQVKDPAGNPVPLFQGDLTKIPAWVPRPAGVSETSALHLDLPDRVTGILIVTTTDTTEAVKKFFEGEASKLSLNVSSSSSSALNGAARQTLRYRGGKREIVVNSYSTAGSPLTSQTIYTEWK